MKTRLGTLRYNNRMTKIYDGFKAHVDRQRTENPAWYEHHTTHLMSKTYEGCAYCSKPAALPTTRD
jgi:hypothetical protein